MVVATGSSRVWDCSVRTFAGSLPMFSIICCAVDDIGPALMLVVVFL